MILIADSGSTKTDWRLIDEHKKIHSFSTQGLNPYFLSAAEISKELRASVIPALRAGVLVDELYFYGSGCRAAEKRNSVQEALQENFPKAKVEVHTDLLGAARALCGKKEGIAAILGTGSSVCHYDGTKIIQIAPSLGYILGDEGSGAHLGKLFISALLNEKLSPGLSSRFYERYKTDKDAILDAIYSKPFANRYLASFTRFIHQNLAQQEMTDLAVESFRDFFSKQVEPLREKNALPFHCSGSIGFYFSNILRGVAEEKNIPPGTIIEFPIAALANYHLGE